jgi:hypothetical protein
MNYRKCVAYRKEWVNERTARRRVEWVTVMIKRYFEKTHWNRVRFSDEVLFEWDLQDKLFVIRQFDERYCQDCIPHADEFDAKDVKRHHCRTTVNHDFKSDIYFFNVSNNVSEKMSQRVYINQILKLIMKSWSNHDFVLEEDNDSDHDSSKSNIVRTWKKTHNLKSYFNCDSSSNLSSVENCWVVSKQHVRKFLHWDDATIKNLIVKKWTHFSQSFINEKMIEMPHRLKTIIDEDDQIIDY